MDDLISKTGVVDILRAWAEMVTGTPKSVLFAAADMIEKLPALYAKPVIYGKWLRTDAYPHHVYCSMCYKTFVTNEEFLKRYEIPNNFCPNCGAKMSEVDLVDGNN